MFIKVIFLTMLSVLTYAQDIDTNNTEKQNTNTNASSFFDMLPVNENIETNEQPTFLRNLQNRDNDNANNVMGAFIRAVIGFILFFFVLYIVWYFIKKRSKSISGANNIINVLATTSIAQNKHLSVIEIADHLYFISVTDKNINLISEIEDKDTKDIIRMAYSNSDNNIIETPFTSMFDTALTLLNIKRKNKENPLDTTKKIKQRMKRMDDEIEKYLDTEDKNQNLDEYSKNTIKSRSKKNIKK